MFKRNRPFTVHHDLEQSGLEQCGTIEPGGYSFHAQIYAQPSKFGIEGGRISKLDIRNAQGEKIVVYSRGFALDAKGREEKLSSLQKNLIQALQTEFAVGKPWSPAQLAVLEAAEHKAAQQNAERGQPERHAPAHPNDNPMGFFMKGKGPPPLFVKDKVPETEPAKPDASRRNAMEDKASHAAADSIKAEPELELEFEIEGADGGTFSDQLDGTITSRADPAVKYHWSLSDQRKPTTECLEGTTISRLRVVNELNGKTALNFDRGQWLAPPQDAIAAAIRDKFVEDYADGRPREMALSDRERAAMPIGLTQDERASYFEDIRAQRTAEGMAEAHDGTIPDEQMHEIGAGAAMAAARPWSPDDDAAEIEAEHAAEAGRKAPENDRDI